MNESEGKRKTVLLASNRFELFRLQEKEIECQLKEKGRKVSDLWKAAFCFYSFRQGLEKK